MKYLVQSISKSETRSKKIYLRLKLLEEGGKAWPAVFWDPGSFEPKTGDYIDALTEESAYNGEPQLTVKAARVVGAATDDSFLPRTPYSIDGLIEELQGFITSVQDEHLRRLLTELARDERWRKAPAAQSMHHAYLGGLLEHTVNLCRLADAIARLYKDVRRDLLITAAVIHDVGKMDEMACATVIEYTPAGQLIGHIVLGHQRLTRLMDKLQTPAIDANGVATQTRLLVEHLLLSHHGNLQYGSPKEPQLLEAQVFSHLDGIDASIGAMLAAIAKTSPGKQWSDGVGKYNKQQLWLGEEAKKP